MSALLDSASMPRDIESCVAAVNAMDNNAIAEKLRTCNPTVTINVGARHFLTRCLTLLQDHTLPAASDAAPSSPSSVALDNASLSAPCPSHTLATLLVRQARDTAGFFSVSQRGASPLELIIDRDGTHFRYILNYLREGPQRVVLPSDVAALQELMNEAHFYQLPGLERLIQAKLNAFSDCCLQSGSKCIGRNRSKYQAANAFVDAPFICASSARAPLIRCSSLRNASECPDKAEQLRDLEDAYRSCSIPHAVSASKNFSFNAALDTSADNKLDAKHRRKSFPNSRFTFIAPPSDSKNRPQSSVSPVSVDASRAPKQVDSHSSKIQQEMSTPDIVEGPIVRSVRLSPTAGAAPPTVSAAPSASPSAAVVPIMPLFYSASLPPKSSAQTDSITFTISSPAIVTVTASPIPPPSSVAQRPTAPPTPASTAVPSPSPSVSQIRSSASTPSVSVRSDLPDHIAHAQASLVTPRTLSATPSKNVFTWDEISLHNTAASCWLVVSGKVYNVTSFLSRHPATPGVILKKGGKDATEDFKFHSKIAHRSWKRLEIGKVKSDSSCVVM